MSVLRELVTKRLWLSVGLTLAVTLTVCALGALAVAGGVTDVGGAQFWVCAAWLVGTFAGGRCASTGKSRALLHSLLNGVLSVGLLWLLGITSDEGGISACWGWYMGVAVVGAFLGALLSNNKKRARRTKGREAHRATGSR